MSKATRIAQNIKSLQYIFSREKFFLSSERNQLCQNLIKDVLVITGCKEGIFQREDYKRSDIT